MRKNSLDSIVPLSPSSSSLSPPQQQTICRPPKVSIMSPSASVPSSPPFPSSSLLSPTMLPNVVNNNSLSKSFSGINSPTLTIGSSSSNISPSMSPMTSFSSSSMVSPHQSSILPSFPTSCGLPTASISSSSTSSSPASSPIQKPLSTSGDSISNTNSSGSPANCKYHNCLVCQRGPPPIVLKSPTWSTIMRVVFYTLSKSFPDRPFFNLRTDVYAWMVEHWDILCAESKDKSHNWRKQVQDMLSHSKNLFESGTEHYKQNGFWRLKPSADIDPWTIKKPQRDRSKIPSTSTTKSNKRSNDEIWDSPKSSGKKLKLKDDDDDNNCQVPIADEITIDYLMDSDSDILHEMETVNNEIELLRQKVKVLKDEIHLKENINNNNTRPLKTNSTSTTNSFPSMEVKGLNHSLLEK
eukprot:gene3805-4734_t